jgi:hypothetical protein
MLLPIFVLSIATIMLVMAYQNTKKNDTTTKVFLVFCYLLVIAICIKYGVINNKQLLEGFEVQIPDMDENEDTDEEKDNNSTQTTKGVEGVSLQDLENVSNMSTTLNNLKEQINDSKNNSNDSSNINSNNSSNDTSNDTSVEPSSEQSNDRFENIIQKDSEGTHSVFKPQIIINTNDGSQTDDLSMYMPNANVFVPKEQQNNNTDNRMNNSMVMTPRRRNELLNGDKKSTEDLFANGSISQQKSNDIKNVNTEPTEDAFNWISTYKNQYQSGSDNSKQYSQERFNDQNTTYVSRPFVEETRSMIDPSTLTNNSYVPGMQYIPPSNWRQPNNTITIDSRVGNTGYRMNTRNLPIAMMDHGTPINALEIGSDGTIAKTEDEVHLTNVGSIMPKFEYREYIDHYSTPSNGTTTTTQASTTTTIPGSML